MSASLLAPPGPVGLLGPAVQVSEVTKRFGRLTVLDRVSFQVRAGCVTAMLGPNAAGKSTLLKAMLGLVRPEAGRIVIDGAVLNGDPGYRARMGYMPQAARFPENLTGREVVMLLRDLRRSGREDDELFREFELEREMDRPIRTLSGGTRQKLNAAVAFLFRPSLLILDEPTAGLDPVASGILKEKIRRARQTGVSVILSSHILAELEELADDVLFLLEGRVAFAGAIHRLKESTGQDRLERAIARLMKRRVI
jgi:Cu-processing system ATP-binding protein